MIISCEYLQYFLTVSIFWTTEVVTVTFLADIPYCIMQYTHLVFHAIVMFLKKGA